jgi:F-box protein, helicase, 18
MDKLTEEQKKIVECDGQWIAIQAFAGSGKTTTLDVYSKLRPEKKFLYLCFNKDAKESAGILDFCFDCLREKVCQKRYLQDN